MTSEWHPLDDVIEDILDRRGVTPAKLGGAFTNAGHRVISAKVVKGGRIDLAADEARFVDAAVYKKWMKTPLRADDVVMTSEAPLGELAYLDRDVDWVLGQRLFAIRPRRNVLSGRFLYYVLATPRVRDNLIARSTGTTVTGIRQAELRKVEIPVPPFSRQVEVAEMLGALDDRLDNLRQSNDTLQAMAAALFQSWFVKFEGVPQESMRDSELGLIPEGWRVGVLADLCELRYGKALKASERRAGPFPVYGSGGVTGYHDEALVTKPTIIVGRKGTVGSLYWQSGPCFPIDTVFYVEPKVSLHYCYYAMLRLGLQNLNTDAAVPGLNRENAYRQPVLIPDSDALSKWDAFASAVRARMDNANEQASTLAAMRATLLPHLISSNFQVKQ